VTVNTHIFFFGLDKDKDTITYTSWFSSIKFISNKIAQSLDLKNKKICNAILNTFFINEWNKNKEKFSDGKLSTYLTVKNNFGFEEYLDKLRVLNR
jgi:hypothetical protein